MTERKVIAEVEFKPNLGDKSDEEILKHVGLTDLEIDQISDSGTIDSKELKEQFEDFKKLDVSKLAGGRKFARGVVLVKVFKYVPAVRLETQIYAGETKPHFNKAKPKPIFETKSFKSRVYPIAKVLAIGVDCKSSVKDFEIGDFVEISDAIVGYMTNPKFEEWIEKQQGDGVGEIIGVDGAPPMVIKSEDLFKEHVYKFDKFNDLEDDTILRLGEEQIQCNANSLYA